MNILVSGATGLIGRSVTEQLLEQGNSVVAIVRGHGEARVPEGASTIACDLGRDTPARAELGPLDAVVHLAQSSRYRDFPGAARDVLAVAMSAAVGLATLAVEVGASRLVLASSGGVYAPSSAPLTESSPLGPTGELGYYLTVKRVTEELVEQFRPMIGISVLRYFFVYGPGQSTQMFVSRLVESVRDGRAVALPGGRGPRVNPVFVTDAAAATVAALDPDAPDVLNVAGPEVVDVRGLCDTVGELVGREPVYEETAAGPGDLVGATTLLDKIAPPRVGVRDGIGRLLDGP